MFWSHAQSLALNIESSLGRDAADSCYGERLRRDSNSEEQEMKEAFIAYSGNESVDIFEFQALFYEREILLVKLPDST